MAQELRRDMLGTLLAGFRGHGDLVAYRFGPARGPLRRAAVAAHHPDQVHQVFTGGAFGRGATAFEVLAEVVGRGLLTADGEMWRRQRRTLQPLFTPRRVAGYAELMTAEAARVVDDPDVRAGSVVDLHLLMLRYTLRVVGRALFGDEIDDMVPVLHRLMPVSSDLTLARSLQIARLPLSWPTPRNRRLAGTRRELCALVDGVLARHAGTEDMVSLLRAARDPETGQPLSAREIRDQVMIFLLAGQETTAGALTFTLHQLGRHPEIQDRVAGDEGLCRAALMEGMRLYPPAYLTQRLTTEDVPLGGYLLPRATLVMVSAWVTHRHPAFWPDPSRFDPARFTGAQNRPRYAYFPFGGGPRSCIGEHFALLEATILLRALLDRYRVETLDAVPALAPLVSLRPAAPIRARLTPR
jgi:cytochrome P450